MITCTLLRSTRSHICDLKPPERHDPTIVTCVFHCPYDTIDKRRRRVLRGCRRLACKIPFSGCVNQRMYVVSFIIVVIVVDRPTNLPLVDIIPTRVSGWDSAGSFYTRWITYNCIWSSGPHDWDTGINEELCNYQFSLSLFLSFYLNLSDWWSYRIKYHFFPPVSVSYSVSFQVVGKTDRQTIPGPVRSFLRSFARLLTRALHEGVNREVQLSICRSANGENSGRRRRWRYAIVSRRWYIVRIPERINPISLFNYYTVYKNTKEQIFD